MKTAHPTRILVVDDNNFILRVAEDVLTDCGHQVRTLEAADAVVDTVKRIKPQLLILDIMMPEVDGIEICRTLKADPETQDVLILIHSGKKDMELMDLCYEAGAAGYHIKSGDVATLAEAVERVVAEKMS